MIMFCIKSTDRNQFNFIRIFDLVVHSNIVSLLVFFWSLFFCFSYSRSFRFCKFFISLSLQKYVNFAANYFCMLYLLRELFIIKGNEYTYKLSAFKKVTESLSGIFIPLKCILLKICCTLIFFFFFSFPYLCKIE